MVGLLWEFDLLVAFDATKSYNNGIKPGGRLNGREGVCPLLSGFWAPVVFVGAVEVLYLLCC